jgi:hypothetical protein
LALPAGFSSSTVYVDGENLNGATTTGSVNVYNYTGAFLGSQAFSSSSITYDLFVTFPAAQFSQYAYVSTFVTLPGSGNGIFFGTTVAQ